VVPTRPGVEVTRRTAEDGRSWVFVVNHTDEPASCELTGHDLVADRPVTGVLELAAGGVAVVREGT
jgi:beta-galactosidase